MHGSGDMILVGAGELEAMAGQISTAHSRLDSGFVDLTGQLQRTLAEWGDGTTSRQAFADFTARVDRIFAEMLAAQSKMPPVVQQAAQDAVATERYLATTVWS